MNEKNSDKLHLLLGMCEDQFRCILVLGDPSSLICPSPGYPPFLAVNLTAKQDWLIYTRVMVKSSLVDMTNRNFDLNGAWEKQKDKGVRRLSK